MVVKPLQKTCPDDYLSVVEDRTLWKKVDVDQLEFAEDPTANPFVAFGGNEFKCVTLSLNGGLTYIPWASTALTSVLNRCEISGKGIERLFSANKREFCALLNSTIHLVDKGQREMLALIREDTLGALHSGRYTPISEKNLYEIAEEYEKSKRQGDRGRKRLSQRVYNTKIQTRIRCHNKRGICAESYCGTCQEKTRQSKTR